jgi:signal transduction histidine kinase
MKKPIRILHLEDNPADAEIVSVALKSGLPGFQLEHVKTEQSFVSALDRNGFDLILADYAMPGFDGLSALEMVREKHPETPCILVSGSAGEEIAVECLKRGAMDYIHKDRLSRLVPAVQRALREADERVESRKREEQVTQCRQMEAVGQLAAGIAHDFNNVLSVVMGFSELLSLEAANETHRGYADAIRQAAEKASGLTRQLLIFSQKQAPQASILNPNEAIQDMEKMLRRLVDENIETSIFLGRDIYPVKVDTGHLWQLLMNLVVNAQDAMPNGGKLKIATRNVSVSTPRSPAGPGDYVVISVTDTGTGMTEAVKSRLFEAFFTTKPPGRGTGLGLATCQTIAKQCGAHIEVISEVGLGSRFDIYIPKAESPLAPRGASVRRDLMPRGTETVLLVEDEPTVRDLARIVLEQQGYHVVSACHGKDGLNLARTYCDGPIELVVTDVVMPHMDGPTMSQAVKGIFPGIKTLFTSGYTEDAVIRKGTFDSNTAFLAKPYTAATLARKVREMLDA